MRYSEQAGFVPGYRRRQAILLRLNRCVDGSACSTLPATAEQERHDDSGHYPPTAYAVAAAPGLWYPPPGAVDSGGARAASLRPKGWRTGGDTCRGISFPDIVSLLRYRGSRPEINGIRALMHRLGHSDTMARLLLWWQETDAIKRGQLCDATIYHKFTAFDCV